MLLWQVLKQTVGENKNLRVLDLCAAPGGKSTLLSSYFDEGLVVSNEVIKQRVSVLYENITKWGNENVVITNNDAKNFAALEGYFDVIVVDAPCSGSGLFRKDEDAISEWSVENVSLCNYRQQRILVDVVPALKENGILIYSTCSYSKEENEDILDWLMENTNLETIDLIFPEEWGVEITESERYNASGFRCWPYKTKGEGFFIAAMRKKSGNEKYFKPIPTNPISKNELNLLKDWIKQDGLSFFKHQEDIHAIPSNFISDITWLQKNLYVKKAGINSGCIKGKDFIPHHELALSCLLNEEIQKISFSKEEALEFLRKNDLIVSNNQKGWALAAFSGLGLGWMKILLNRINNYYPAAWRILKQ